MAVIRAVVSDEEKANVKLQAQSLGMNESQMIRAGLKKMGVSIEVEKAEGAPAGNNRNPKGNPRWGKKETEE